MTSRTKNKAIFLDRDGVINKPLLKNGKPYPPRNLEQLELLPGVDEAMSKLKLYGYKLIVVTNQPDVARGTLFKDDVESINLFLIKRLGIDALFVCYHDDDDNCQCRKPLPGAILNAEKSMNIDLSRSYMIGDRWKDISAGRAAGVKTIFIDYGYDEIKPKKYDFLSKSLIEALPFLLTKDHEKY